MHEYLEESIRFIVSAFCAIYGSDSLSAQIALSLVLKHDPVLNTIMDEMKHVLLEKGEIHEVKEETEEVSRKVC